jgi:flagellar basal-body rod protein FlgB
MPNAVDNWGSLPYLERMMQFAGARGELLNDAVANLDTPGYVARDVSVSEFQGAMRSARASERSGSQSPTFRDTRNIDFQADSMQLDPVASGDQLLFHDGNDRSLERLMQGLSENVLAFRYAAELFRSTHDTLHAAIRLRP